MDAERFDALLRSLSQTPTRRGALRVLIGSALGGLMLDAVSAGAKKRGKAKEKGNGKGKKGKVKQKVTLCHDGQTIRVVKPVARVLIKLGDGKGPCVPPSTPNPPPEPTCSPACRAGMRCAGGQCVVGQGTCPPGGSTCLSNSGAGDCWLQAQEISENCQCEISTEGETRCADGFGPNGTTGCGECASSAECESLFPGIAGVFCVKASGATNDCCTPGKRGFCMVPCPTPATCSVPEDCPDTLPVCVVPTCSNGLCGKAFAPDGTPLPAEFQSPGDCRVKVCDGQGDSRNQIDDTDLPDDSNPCTDNVCTNGSFSNPPLPAGTDCANGGTCDGAGNCVP
jgi:hypothetical protein